MTPGQAQLAMQALHPGGQVILRTLGAEIYHATSPLIKGRTFCGVDTGAGLRVPASAGFCHSCQWQLELEGVVFPQADEAQE